MSSESDRHPTLHTALAAYRRGAPCPGRVGSPETKGTLCPSICCFCILAASCSCQDPESHNCGQCVLSEHLLVLGPSWVLAAARHGHNPPQASKALKIHSFPSGSAVRHYVYYSLSCSNMTTKHGCCNQHHLVVSLLLPNITM